MWRGLNRITLDAVSNITAAGGLILAPIAVAGLTGNGWWAAAVVSAELLAVSVLCGMAAGPAEQERTGSRTVRRAPAA